MTAPVDLTIFAVEQTGSNGVRAVYPEDIRGTYDQAHDVMTGRLVFGEQRIVQMTVDGTWQPVTS